MNTVTTRSQRDETRLTNYGRILYYIIGTEALLLKNNALKHFNQRNLLYNFEVIRKSKNGVCCTVLK